MEVVQSINPWQFAFIALTWFAGFFIRGAFGFGSNLPIILLCTWILGPHHAVILTLLGSFAVQIYLFPQGIKGADWSIVWPISAGLLLGIIIGTSFFATLDGSWLTLIMGLLILCILLGERYSLIQKLAEHINLRSLKTILSLATVSGSVGSVSGGGGMYFLMPYLKHICPTPALLRNTNLALGGLFMIGRITGVAVIGFVSWPLIVQATLLLPAAFLGAWTGSRFYGAASSKRFYTGLTILLLLLAAATTIRGLTSVFAKVQT